MVGVAHDLCADLGRLVLRSIVINQFLIGSDVAEAYRKLPRGVGREIGAVLVWEWLLVART